MVGAFWSYDSQHLVWVKAEAEGGAYVSSGRLLHVKGADAWIKRGQTGRHQGAIHGRGRVVMRRVVTLTLTLTL